MKFLLTLSVVAASLKAQAAAGAGPNMPFNPPSAGGVNTGKPGVGSPGKPVSLPANGGRPFSVPTDMLKSSSKAPIASNPTNTIDAPTAPASKGTSTAPTQSNLVPTPVPTQAGAVSSPSTTTPSQPQTPGNNNATPSTTPSPTQTQTTSTPPPTSGSGPSWTSPSSGTTTMPASPTPTSGSINSGSPPPTLASSASAKQSTIDPGPRSSDPRPQVTNGGRNLYPYTAEIKQYIVDAQNNARATLVPTEAANMRALSWDESLAIEASELVDTCVFEHDTENSAYGQNLIHGGSAIDKDAVNDWITGWVTEEISESDRAGNGFMDLDHASAVLWANSYAVGCASKKCPNGFLTACNYFSPGNWQGERTYVPGKACSQCPSQAPYCDATYGKLCTADPTGATTPSINSTTVVPGPAPSVAPGINAKTEPQPVAVVAVPTPAAGKPHHPRPKLCHS